MTIDNIFTAAALALTLAAGLISCAREVEADSHENEQKRINAHLELYYKDANIKQTAQNGVNYCILKEGSGSKVPADSGYVFVHQNVYNFSYDIIETTYENISKQLGTYSTSTHYAPKMLRTGISGNMIGLEEGIVDMKVGEKRRLIIPTWLSGYTLETSYKQLTEPTIYEVEVVDATKDIEQYELDRLEAFRQKHFPTVDSLKKGFYKVTLQESLNIRDSIDSCYVVKTWYVAKFLDGFVFDTNIKDTATFYSIYNESNNYDYFECTTTNLAETSNSSNAIPGFNRAVQTMCYGEKALFFFTSNYGYGANGSSSSGNIPGYTPLMFYIEVPYQVPQEVEE